MGWAGWKVGELEQRVAELEQENRALAVIARSGYCVHSTSDLHNCAGCKIGMLERTLRHVRKLALGDELWIEDVDRLLAELTPRRGDGG